MSIDYDALKFAREYNRTEPSVAGCDTNAVDEEIKVREALEAIEAIKKAGERKTLQEAIEEISPCCGKSIVQELKERGYDLTQKKRPAIVWTPFRPNSDTDD